MRSIKDSCERNDALLTPNLSKRIVKKEMSRYINLYNTYKQELCNTLMRVGLLPKYIGFNELIESVIKGIESPSRLRNKKKHLYSLIRNNIKNDSIDKNMRVVLNNRRTANIDVELFYEIFNTKNIYDLTPAAAIDSLVFYEKKK